MSDDHDGEPLLTCGCDLIACISYFCISHMSTEYGCKLAGRGSRSAINSMVLARTL